MGMRAFCVTRFAGNPVENVRCAPVHCHSTGSSNKKKSVSSFPRRQLIASIPALIALAECQAAQAGTIGLQVPSGWAAFGKLQPGAVKVPRKTLNLNFAVLLMRSTYEAADALDFIAMDKFQVNFFKLRQSEFEAYKLLVDPLPVPVGNLASPIYFDFIAFSQWATISAAMRDAPQVFSEYCADCEGEPLERPYKVIRRDPALADNSKLPQFLQLQVGRNILSYMQSGFRDETYNVPSMPARTATVAELAVSVQELLDIFVANGFAIRAKVGNVVEGKGGGGSWKVTLEGPANLWGVQTLQFRRAQITDTFDGLAVLAFLDAAGFDCFFEVEADSTTMEQSWTVSPKRAVTA